MLPLMVGLCAEAAKAGAVAPIAIAGVAQASPFAMLRRGRPEGAAEATGLDMRWISVDKGIG